MQHPPQMGISPYFQQQQQGQLTPQHPYPQQQKWTVPQISSINTATSSDSNEPTIKKHVKERLDFNNISAIQQQQQLQLQQQKLTSYKEQYNKENKVIVKESKVYCRFKNKTSLLLVIILFCLKSIVVSPSGSLTKTVFNTDLINSSSTTNVEPQVEQLPVAVKTTTTIISSSTKLVNNVSGSPKSFSKSVHQMDERV